jgi:hypothetical protein
VVAHHLADERIEKPKSRGKRRLASPGSGAVNSDFAMGDVNNK